MEAPEGWQCAFPVAAQPPEVEKVQTAWLLLHPKMHIDIVAVNMRFTSCENFKHIRYKLARLGSIPCFKYQYSIANQMANK